MRHLKVSKTYLQIIGLSSLDVNIFTKQEGSHATIRGGPAGQVTGIKGWLIDLMNHPWRSGICVSSTPCRAGKIRAGMLAGDPCRGDNRWPRDLCQGYRLA
jgi:hypothetical protein